MNIDRLSKDECLKEALKILKKYKGIESEIPHQNHDDKVYWDLMNKYRKVDDK